MNPAAPPQNIAQDALKYTPANLQHNAQVMLFARSSVAAVTGAAAGVLGLTGKDGFVFYGITWLVMSFVLWSLKTRFRPDLYFKNGAREIWTEGVFGGLLSFILFHTFLYGMVHLYQ
ncbi:hypothetical protein BC936DRAFT_149503 [Jimgerdemannia flammicorona]|uniref:Uncharacterized protein n=2 Tax=Jimgerdemannia flammicorona TaxID=994334 RepID=A0A433QHS3_9FUNG|nr:hypothetical protein BC936DRAFT_149503 [Jimgerdemannia flammicorona]RUS29353.1 hypothetical protein BC938DRAFT_480766 [Jimgerdemannia flammicorona]